MQVFINDTYESMSANAAEGALGIIQSIKKPLLCTASGDSPAGLYKEMIHKVSNNKMDISGWYFVSLDEWKGINGDDEGSCRFHLDNQLFRPLQVESNHIGFFDGRANDLQMECDKIEAFIKNRGGIDLAIVGLGMNGHVGMNEPGTPPSLHSHVAEIDRITQEVGQKYFKETRTLTHGITLGIADIMEAANVFLLVSGSAKADILKQVLEGGINDQVPASHLRNHKNLSVYLDAGAARLLETK